MKNKLHFGLRDVVLLLIGLIPLVVAAIYYAQLPEQLAIHFNWNGKADGFIRKGYGLLLMGIMTLLFPILVRFTRNIDPKRNNYFKFEGTFELMRLCVTLLLSGLFVFTIFYNLGYTSGIQDWGISAAGILLIILGNVLSRVRSNYFIGIRTPWTLSNEEVWKRTHRFSGPIYMIAGLLLLLSLAFENPAPIAITALVLLVLIPTGYSYLISRKINSKNGGV
jgi:uncharacterized membrane protein